MLLHYPTSDEVSEQQINAWSVISCELSLLFLPSGAAVKRGVIQLRITFNI